MKVTIKGYITYRKYSWDEKPTYTVYGFDPTNYIDADEVLLMEHDFEVEVPDNFDPRPGQIAALKAKKEKVQAEFSQRVKEIDEKINSLLALEA